MNNPYRLFVFLIIIPVYSFFCFVFGFNILVDGGTLIHRERIVRVSRKIAESLDLGLPISNFVYADITKIKEESIKIKQEKIDMIVFGSSRSMEIQKEFIEDKGIFLNHGLSRCTLGDYISIVGMYKKIKGYIPKKILICVDPWIFDKNDSYGDNLKGMDDYYYYMIKEIGVEDGDYLRKQYVPETKFDETLSKFFCFDYTCKNIKTMNKLLSNSNFYFDVVKDIEKEKRWTMLFDLSILREDVYIFRGQDLIDKDARDLGLFACKFSEISNQKIFERFIDYLYENGTEVAFFLVPYHPYSYDLMMENNYRIIQEVEDYLFNYARKKEIFIMGSYNPYKIKAINTDFVDGFHATKNFIKRYIRENSPKNDE